jgi:hypothetical protein
MKPTKAEEAADMAARQGRVARQRVTAGAATLADRNVPVRPKTKTSRQKEDLLKGGIAVFVVALLALIAAAIMASLTSAGNAICSSDLGLIGESISSTVAAKCTMYTTVNGVGQALNGLGIFGMIAGAVIAAVGDYARYSATQSAK